MNENEINDMLTGLSEDETDDSVDEVTSSEDDITTEEVVEEKIEEQKTIIEEKVETKDTSKVESKSETTSEHNNNSMVPIAAMLDERDKRKKAVAELEELKAQLAEIDAAKNHDNLSVEDRIREELRKEITDEVRKMERVMRVDNHELMIKDKYEDYEAVKDYFVEEAQANKKLAEEFNSILDSGKNAAEFAYQKGKELMAAKEFASNPSAFTERLRAEILKELNSKLESSDSSNLQEKSVPASTTDVRTATSSSNNIFNETSLDEIFKQ